jgi:hypothetical protein
MKVFWGVFFLSFLWGCGAKKIPEFHRPVFVLDNRDPQHVVLRYKNDAIILEINDPQLKGSVVFLPDDFIEFGKIYMGGCVQWDGDPSSKGPLQ